MIGIYLIFAAISDPFVISLAAMGIPNLWFWSYYGSMELCLLAGFFFYFLPHTSVRISLGLNLIVFLTIAFATKLLFGNPTEVLGKVQVIESFIVVLYSIVYLVWHYRDPFLHQPYEKSNFSLISGFIWYFSGNIIFYSVAHFIYQHPELSLWKFYLFHNFNHLIMNLLMARAFWVWPKSSKAFAPFDRSKP